MLRTLLLGLLAAALLLPAPASSVIRRRPIVIVCAEPEKKSMDRYTDVFEATLDGIDVIPASKKRRGLQAELHYAFRFAIQRRFKGDLEGVATVLRFGKQLPAEIDGARYLVFAGRIDGRPFFEVCGLLEGEEVEVWRMKVAPEGVDVSGRLKAKRRTGSAPEIQRWRKQVEAMQWKERLRSSLAREIRELRSRLETRDEEAALELWMHVRRRTAAAYRSAGKSQGRAVAPELLPELAKELTRLLIARAGEASGTMEYGAARRLWQRALLVTPRHPEARRALADLDARANKVFQEAYDSRESHPTLARAGLREVIRMTAASSELQGRARQLLAKLEASRPAP